MNTAIPIDQITNLLSKEISGAFSQESQAYDCTLLMPQKNVADDSTKILISNQKKPIGVILCAKTSLSDIPNRNANRAIEIKAKLSGAAQETVLAPLAHGSKEGIGYTIWPYIPPISKNRVINYLQRKYHCHAMFHWIIDSSKQSKTSVSTENLESHFILPLEQLSKDSLIAPEIRSDIQKQISGLSNREWAPYHVMAHNDLWTGNILLNKKNTYGISIIDWAGADYESFAVYDLVRLAMNLRVGDKFFVAQLRSLCDVLECDPEHARGHLLSSFAHLAANLDNFPHDRFVKLIDISYKYLKDRT